MLIRDLDSGDRHSVVRLYKVKTSDWLTILSPLRRVKHPVKERGGEQVCTECVS